MKIESPLELARLFRGFVYLATHDVRDKHAEIAREVIAGRGKHRSVETAISLDSQPALMSFF